MSTRATPPAEAVTAADMVSAPQIATRNGVTAADLPAGATIESRHDEWAEVVTRHRDFARRQREAEQKAREERRLAEASRRAAEFCGRCRRPLAAGETVWVSRLGCLARYAPTVLCGQCTDGRPADWSQPVPCEGCGRGVVRRRPWSSPWKAWRRTFCSDRCRWTAGNRRRNEAAAAARHKRCATCARQFVGTRRDAVTCSPACRQRAYRQRHPAGRHG